MLYAILLASCLSNAAIQDLGIRAVYPLGLPCGHYATNCRRA